MKAGELLAARRGLAVTDDLLTVTHDALRLVQNRLRQGATCHGMARGGGPREHAAQRP